MDNINNFDYNKYINILLENFAKKKFDYSYLKLNNKYKNDKYKNDKYIYINSLKKVKWNDNIEEIYY